MHELAIPTSIVSERAASAVRAVAPVDDVALYERFVDGDDTSFLELYRRHNQRVFAYCMKHVRGAAQAEDLTQEAWARLVDTRTAAQRLHNPVGFLVRVARNLCLDYLRSRRRLTSLDEMHESSVPHQGMHVRSEREEIILDALDRLPIEAREILVLNMYSGYRFDEIATMLGKTSEAVWARASRARAQLRAAVERSERRDAKRNDDGGRSTSGRQS